jgi:ferrochelatase
MKKTLKIKYGIKGVIPLTEKTAARQEIAIVLLNMGGPEKLEDVEPFLFNLFSDRLIIRLGPAFMQKFIARFISRKRAPKSSKTYELIGGGSPLGKTTADQAAALEKLLVPEGPYKVAVAMRYWHPRAEPTLHDLRLIGINKIIALPLYPHYSIATSGSSLEDLRKVNFATPSPCEIAEIPSWQTQPLYIEALADGIRKSLESFGSEKVQVVYSAHSLPVKFIQEGDPYVDHLKETIAAVEKITNVPGKICYQSRSGPVEWLTPSTPEMIEQLASEGCKNILMVPISFVSDHVETLYEVDMLYKGMANKLGMRLERSPSLNLNPKFIKALKELVLDKIADQNW